MRYVEKIKVVEAITFQELVEHGRDYCNRHTDGNMVNGVPWSFQYRGHPITHEHDGCYLVPSWAGTLNSTIEKFTQNKMLVSDGGRLYLYEAELFTARYTPVRQAFADLEKALQIVYCDERPNPEVRIQQVDKSHWNVEKVLRDGAVEVAVFSGPNAEARAKAFHNLCSFYLLKENA
jgi:hypothetical protein